MDLEVKPTVSSNYERKFYQEKVLHRFQGKQGNYSCEELNGTAVKTFVKSYETTQHLNC